MIERLQKILAHAGIASRRAAEGLITSGRVAVNGIVVTELGAKADPALDQVTLDGKPVRVSTEKLYILLNKPVGYVTTLKDPEGRPVVTDLLKGVKGRVYPVGRLDYNTEGLLLLTNDGELANRLAHPSHEVEKEYMVRVRGAVAPDQLRILASGVELDDGLSAPAEVKLVRESENNSWLSITIHEGRFRQVRRMCEGVGLTVVRLKRTRYALLEAGEMRPGEFRFLTPAEVEGLRALSGLGRTAGKTVSQPQNTRPQKVGTSAGTPKPGAGARRPDRKPDSDMRGPSPAKGVRPGARNKGKPAGKGATKGRSS